MCNCYMKLGKFRSMIYSNSQGTSSAPGCYSSASSEQRVKGYRSFSYCILRIVFNGPYVQSDANSYGAGNQ